MRARAMFSGLATYADIRAAGLDRPPGNQRARPRKVLEKYRDQILPPLDHEVDIEPICIKELLEGSDSIERKRIARKLARKQIEEHERDDHEALEEAAADLIRLDRYERRSWSRQKRAIRSFMNLKIMSNMNRVRTSDQSNHLQSRT